MPLWQMQSLLLKSADFKFLQTATVGILAVCNLHRRSRLLSNRRAKWLPVAQVSKSAGRATADCREIRGSWSLCMI
jgi:hypothetical protein